MAKTSTGLKRLSESFATRSVEKTYIAVVEGDFSSVRSVIAPYAPCEGNDKGEDMGRGLGGLENEGFGMVLDEPTPLYRQGQQM